jgi:hypothetical protein
MKMTSALLIAGILTTLTADAQVDLSKLPPASSKTGVTFQNDIFPIFKDSCVRCHGEEKPKAGLRLDSAEAAVMGSKRKNGTYSKVLVPGDSAKSDLVIAIARLDPETAMPPTRQGRPRKPDAAGTDQPAGGPPPPPAKPLTAEQVALVRAWIDQGAK